MKPNQSTEPQEWLDKAYHDLDAAKKLFDQEGFPDTIAVHCHQTAEKSLKATLLSYQKDFPFTHDLTVLVKLCMKENNRFVEIEDATIALSPLYEEERYPFIEIGSYSEKELQGFLLLAEKIFHFVEKEIKNT